MHSKNILDGVDFERDVPTPPEVSDFLWKLRRLEPMGPYEYLEFLNHLSAIHTPSRETYEGWAPFEL